MVLFHVTANADWSNLPLSGLFVDMLRRLVQRSAGVAGGGRWPAAGPAESLDGFGALGRRRRPPTALPARDMATAAARPAIRPASTGRSATATRSTWAPPSALPRRPAVPGAAAEAWTRHRASAPSVRADRRWRWRCSALDLLLTLRLRGLLAGRGAPPASPRCCCSPCWAPAQARGSPALGTHLAYVVTGDAQVDARVARRAAGLSDYVNRRTAAVLADPAAVTPGQRRPQLLPAAVLAGHRRRDPDPAAVAALNDYMRNGGIILIDTRGGGSGAGFGAGGAGTAAACAASARASTYRRWRR